MSNNKKWGGVREHIPLKQGLRRNYKCRNPKNTKNPLFQAARQKSDGACKNIELIEIKEGHN
jgi:hypothetical protein